MKQGYMADRIQESTDFFGEKLERYENIFTDAFYGMAFTNLYGTL